MLEELINNVDSVILSFVQGSFTTLTPIISILWRLMFIIFIAFFGYKVMLSGKFNASDLMVNTLKIIVLLVLATQWDDFLLVVYNMTTDFPSNIAGVMISNVDSTFAGSVASDEASANTSLSSFYDRSMAISETILEGAGWRDIGKYFYATLIWIGAIGFTGYAAMLIILAKIAVAILLAVGPLFILLLIFYNTKSLFDGWLRTLLNYAVIPIFVYALLALMLSIAERPLQFLESNSAPNDPILTSIGVFFFISIVSMLLLAQVMNMAASVTGGLSLSTMGAGGWASRAGSNFAKAAPRRGAKTGIHGYNMARHPKQYAKAGASRLQQAIKKTRGF